MSDRLKYIERLVKEIPMDNDLRELFLMIYEELAMLRGRTDQSHSFITAIRKEIQR